MIRCFVCHGSFGSVHTYLHHKIQKNCTKHLTKERQ